MKLKFKHISLLAFACVSITSCDLDVIPPSDISTETFWKDEVDANSALNGVYVNCRVWTFGMKCILIMLTAISHGKGLMNWFRQMVLRLVMILVMIIVWFASLITS